MQKTQSCPFTIQHNKLPEIKDYVKLQQSLRPRHSIKVPQNKSIFACQSNLEQYKIKNLEVSPIQNQRKTIQETQINFNQFHTSRPYLNIKYNYKKSQERLITEKKSSVDILNTSRSNRRILITKNKTEYIVDTFYEQIGGLQTLEKVVEYLLSQIHIFPHFKRMYDFTQFRVNLIHFLEFICGQPIFYNLEALRKVHQNLSITNRQFNSFKCILLQGFLLSSKGIPEQLYEFATFIEQYRYIIVNKNQAFAQVYNQKTSRIQSENQDGLTLLALETYQKIYKDPTISPFFIDTPIEQQAPKFAKILNQMMGWQNNIDQTMNLLRKSHIQFHLNNVHFIIFKQYLVQSFREIGLKDKLINIVSQRMDGYRCCVLNEDSFIETVQKIPDGKQVFIKKFKKFIQKDQRLNYFLSNRTNKKFLENHCYFLFHFFAYQQKPLVSYEDIFFFHKNHKIAEKDIQLFEDNFMQTARSLNVIPLQLSDFSDLWLMLKYNILNQYSIAKQIGSKSIIENLSQKIATKLQENQSYSFYFKNVDYQIKFHIKRIISFIFDNTQIFKSSDLKVIHQNLKITSSVFEIFLIIIKTEMEEMGIERRLIEQVERICSYYKDCICSHKESTITSNYILSQIKRK